MIHFFGFGEKKLSMGPFLTVPRACLAFFAGGDDDDDVVDSALRFNGDDTDDCSFEGDAFNVDSVAFSPFFRVVKNDLTDAGGGTALMAS